ncbi:MAG: hypothetical protein IPQ18_03120 [Saprospiraceae bacterium]|nr:hypothetical protein [Saprospiraceae bacterium]
MDIPKKEMGGFATTTPYMVIHHAQSYDARERNFEIVYAAYLNGDIDHTAISFYLGRMYQMKYGVRLQMEGHYTLADEINKLIKELNLEEKSAKIQKKIKP